MANWASVGNVGDPLSPGWTEQNLVPVNVGGEEWMVYRPAAPSFQGLLQELAARGYPLKSSGGYNYRNKRGGNTLSQHAFGNAIDINAATNPFGTHQTDLPGDISQLAAKYGLEWGGNWSRGDPMHFEWKGDGYNAPNPQALGGSSGAAPEGYDPGAIDIFRGRVPASGLFDMPMALNGMQGQMQPQPPMTAERFFTQMIAGQNPLRSMIYSGLMGMFA